MFSQFSKRWSSSALKIKCQFIPHKNINHLHYNEESLTNVEGNNCNSWESCDTKTPGVTIVIILNVCRPTACTTVLYRFKPRLTWHDTWRGSDLLTWAHSHHSRGLQLLSFLEVRIFCNSGKPNAHISKHLRIYILQPGSFLILSVSNMF
jgi:hypothetical protein